MSAIFAGVLMIVEAAIALGILLAIPIAVGYAALSARHRPEPRS